MGNDSKINILNEEVVGKIAAGEVIERPASVVKELIENSIDAGSNSIEIEMEDAGQVLIRIADNGSGMILEDAMISCNRHTTSKLKDADDLYNINTLGFRGEALSSISAISHMDITTYSGKEKTGVYLYLESGEVLKTRPAGRTCGTTIEIRNLFYNVPARKKFLKKESMELSETVNVVGKFILSYPDIEFKLNHEGKDLLYASKDMDMIERIKIVLGGDIADNMIAVEKSISGSYSVGGYISKPASTRKDRRYQIFFVNGRYVKNKVLSNVIYNSYRSMLERGRFPSVVMFLDVPPEELDVNVHPTKLEIKFENEKKVKETVLMAIRDRFSNIKSDELIGYGQSLRTASGVELDQKNNENDSNITLVAPEVQNEFTYDKTPVLSKNNNSSKPLFSREIGEQPNESDVNIFQIALCYIVYVKEESVTIYDQHAVHERILYELFSKVSDGNTPEIQNLLFPIRLDLTADETIIMQRIFENFKCLGFDIEPFGEKSFVVQAVPAILKDRNIKKVIYDILLDIKTHNVDKASMVDELLKLTSCHAAIKSGDKLEKDEMRFLIEQLNKCDRPFTCPHGRPTVIDLSVNDLEKKFRRK